MLSNSPLAPGVFDLRIESARGDHRAAIITIQQLDAAGRVARTFTSYPRTEADVAAKLDAIERGYNLAATRVTVICAPR